MDRAIRLADANEKTESAKALLGEYEQTGEIELLNTAIDYFYKATTQIPASHHDYPVTLSNLGIALQSRYALTSEIEHLDEAITNGLAALSNAPAWHRFRPMFLHHAGRALTSKFECTNDATYLDRGISLLRSAVGEAATGDPGWISYHSTLSVALSMRFALGGHQADIDEATTEAFLAVVNTAADHPERHRYLYQASLTHSAKFNGSGHQADLDDTIAHLRNAVAAAPPTHPDTPTYTSDLGAHLWARFNLSGLETDLDQAAALLQEAVSTTPSTHLNWHRYCANLSLALQDRFEHRGDPDDLNRATSAIRSATMVVPPDHRLYPVYSCTLSGILLTQFEHSHDDLHLKEAITAIRRALDSTPLDHPDRAMYQSNLGMAFATQFEHSNNHVHLEETITTLRHAVDSTPLDHPDRAIYQSNLGNALIAKFEQSQDPAHFEGAITAFSEAVHIDSAPPDHRINAGWAWGIAAVKAGLIASAADGFDSAVQLLPTVIWHGLPWETRERRLNEWTALGRDAAACAVRAGRPERAVELLEVSRAVLWGQALDLRTDLSDLTAQEPQLASRLGEVRAVLSAQLTPTPAQMTRTTAQDSPDSLLARRYEAIETRLSAAREVDRIVEQIRKLDNFTNFLAPAPFTELTAAAAAGPVVIINVSKYGCHALTITPVGVQVISLPDSFYTQLFNHANTFLRIIDTGLDDNKPIRRENDRSSFLDILEWLWDNVCGLVLDDLYGSGQADPSLDLPRIWWCPTGPMVALPIHAAGHYRFPPSSELSVHNTNVPDRVISSYTPTLTALIRARTADSSRFDSRLLAIGMPTTPGANDLPAVRAELDGINSVYSITTRLQSLTRREISEHRQPDSDTRPTIDRVLTEIRRHPYIHISCHGVQDRQRPTESAFLLEDGPLQIAHLVELGDAVQLEMAFLSACRSASGSTTSIDEAIHLAAAMQLVGYRHVIATLWSIMDFDAANVAQAFYSEMSAVSASDDRAAAALHHATTSLRKQHSLDPLIWAAYIHFGI